jgi:hypothetical protein
MADSNIKLRKHQERINSPIEAHESGSYVEWRRDISFRRLGRNLRMTYKVETDGRWIAEILDLPGVLAYGSTEKEGVASAQALALRVRRSHRIKENLI